MERDLERIKLLRGNPYLYSGRLFPFDSEPSEEEKKAGRSRKNAEKVITKLLFDAEKHLVKAEALWQRQKPMESVLELESFKTGKYKNPKKTVEEDPHPESVDWVEVNIIWHTKDRQPKSWYVDKKRGAETFFRRQDDIKLFGFDSLKNIVRSAQVFAAISQIAMMSNPSYESFKLIADKYPDDLVYGPEGALNLILAMQRRFQKKKKSDSFGRIDVYLIK